MGFTMTFSCKSISYFDYSHPLSPARGPLSFLLVPFLFLNALLLFSHCTYVCVYVCVHVHMCVCTYVRVCKALIHQGNANQNYIETHLLQPVSNTRSPAWSPVAVQTMTST